MPIDEGFNKLAWALPYVAASRAPRWSARRLPLVAAPRRRRSSEAVRTPLIARQEDALHARLDDELRDLD
jgi:hypothetical protein